MGPLPTKDFAHHIFTGEEYSYCKYLPTDRLCQKFKFDKRYLLCKWLKTKHTSYSTDTSVVYSGRRFGSSEV